MRRSETARRIAGAPVHSQEISLQRRCRWDAASRQRRQDYVRTFLERGVPQLDIGGSLPRRCARFWTMLAHWHGQIWNGSLFACSYGVSRTTVRRYPDALTDALVVHQLQPWLEKPPRGCPALTRAGFALRLSFAIASSIWSTPPFALDVIKSWTLCISIILDDLAQIAVRDVPYASRPGASQLMKLPQQTLAVELRSAEMALAGFAQKEAWVARLLGRLTATYDLEGPLNILDIGAAQGSITAACIRLGHNCVGVDPAPRAIEQSSYLAARLGLSIEIKLGYAEALPFPNNTFDLVLANSVLEHCADMDAALREIHRVLTRGGVLWFSATSSLSFKQNEIRGFPLFAWYPLCVKRRIMFWCRDRRPHLIGHTSTPAINWLRPGQWKQKLTEVNFSDIHDRWSLRANTDADKLHGFLLRLINAFALLHFLTDVALEGVAFGARKG